MAYKLAYSGLFWEAPHLERELAVLQEAGWDGWEVRQPLDCRARVMRSSSMTTLVRRAGMIYVLHLAKYNMHSQCVRTIHIVVCIVKRRCIVSQFSGVLPVFTLF